MQEIVFKPSRHSSGKASVRARSLKALSGEIFSSLSLRLFLTLSLLLSEIKSPILIIPFVSISYPSQTGRKRNARSGMNQGFSNQYPHNSYNNKRTLYTGYSDVITCHTTCHILPNMKLVRQSQIVQSVMQDYQYDLSHLLPVCNLLVQDPKITYNYCLSRWSGLLW